MSDLNMLRADAESLARQLPDAALQAAAANVQHPGAAGRKRSGGGEQFWQYRHYAQTDGADRIDWRRSARGQDYYVRETELETARSVLFWADPHAGFDWRSDARLSSKLYRAKVIELALGIQLAHMGERIGVIGGPRSPSLGRTAAQKLSEDLAAISTSNNLTPPKGHALAVIASDFYDGVEAWQARLTPLAQTCPSGVLVYVSDPQEHEFPFQGRTRFSRPGTQLERLFGRAETVREAYLSRLADHIQALEALAGRMGWALVRHRTDEPALTGAARLLLALQHFGVKA